MVYSKFLQNHDIQSKWTARLFRHNESCMEIFIHWKVLHFYSSLVSQVFKEVNEKVTETGGKQCPPYEIIGFCNKLYLKYV